MNMTFGAPFDGAVGDRVISYLVKLIYFDNW